MYVCVCAERKDMESAVFMYSIHDTGTQNMCAMNPHTRFWVLTILFSSFGACVVSSINRINKFECISGCELCEVRAHSSKHGNVIIFGAIYNNTTCTIVHIAPLDAIKIRNQKCLLIWHENGILCVCTIRSMCVELTTLCNKLAARFWHYVVPMPVRFNGK